MKAAPVQLCTPEWGGRPAPAAISIGRLYAHAVGFDEAVELIVDRVDSGLGGYVVTPNVDHVVLAEHHHGLREAYNEAWLSVPDGMPLLWIARAAGTPLLEKVSGSDLVLPLLRRAAAEGLRTAFFGATEAVSSNAAQQAVASCPGLKIVAREWPMFDPQGPTSPEVRAALHRLRASRPDIVLVAMGAPRQEIFMQRFGEELRPAVMLGVGASLDFLAGAVNRAPVWMQRNGLEWLFRLMQEPHRLAGRYLARDWRIAPIALRTIVASRRRSAR